jgi:hypothetical protein
MIRRRHIAFLFNLLQDVTMLRPLAYLAARELDASLVFLVSAKFLDRDIMRVWQREIAEIAGEAGASVHIYSSAADAVGVLQGRHGIVIAASESDLGAHADTHDVFRAAPAGFLRITLQHGYECVGFLQNREHVIAHGRNVRFAADVLCGWCNPERLTSLAAGERPKLYVSGPPMLLNAPAAPSGTAPLGGLVCENLHSVRMRMTGDFGKSFMDNFSQFCAGLEAFGEIVHLRPHPGGLYVVKNGVALPRNVMLDTKPIYKTEVSRHSFGISAPSTVLLDMLFAGIPVAVWTDAEGVMDGSNYDGLTRISAAADWFAFARDAVLRRDFILDRQRQFIAGLGMPVEPADIRRRFATLLANGTERLGDIRTREAAPVPKRVLFIANAVGTALYPAFLGPLQALVKSGDMTLKTLTETEAAKFADDEAGRSGAGRAALIAEWFVAQIADFAPDLVVCCGYNGAASAAIVHAARDRGVALLCYADEDLLDVPRDAGPERFRIHNHPDRLRSAETLLRAADAIVCATPALAARMRPRRYPALLVTSDIVATGRVLAPAEMRSVTRLGLLLADASPDFAGIAGEIRRFLRRNIEVSLEIMGAIDRPPELAEFGDQVTMLPLVRAEKGFAQAVAARRWDIALCPVAPTSFNALKSDALWIDFTAAGAAVLATRGTIYDACCGDGCGVLLGDGEWLAALEDLVDNPDRRAGIVANAQRRLAADYGMKRMRAQVLAQLGAALEARDGPHRSGWPHAPAGAIAAASRPIYERVTP